MYDIPLRLTIRATMLGVLLYALPATGQDRGQPTAGLSSHDFLNAIFAFDTGTSGNLTERACPTLTTCMNNYLGVSKIHRIPQSSDHHVPSPVHIYGSQAPIEAEIFEEEVDQDKQANVVDITDEPIGDDSLLRGFPIGAPPDGPFRYD